MKTIWFKQFGLLYIPVHLAGYLITMLAILFLLPVGLSIVRNGQSAGDDLYHFFIYISCTAFWWKWIAEKTSN